MSTTAGDIITTSPLPWRVKILEKDRLAYVVSNLFHEGDGRLEIVAECRGRGCGLNAEMICRAVNQGTT